MRQSKAHYLPFAILVLIVGGRGVRSLKLTKCEFIPGFVEIVSSIYDFILVSFSDVLGSD